MRSFTLNWSYIILKKKIFDIFFSFIKFSFKIGFKKITKWKYDYEFDIIYGEDTEIILSILLDIQLATIFGIFLPIIIPVSAISMIIQNVCQHKTQEFIFYQI